MDSTAAEPPPGCLVLLLRLSAGMTAEVVTSRGETVAVAAVRMLADELLEALVNTVAAGYEVGAIDVAVLGYHTAEDSTPQLFSLLPDGDSRARLVPLARVAEMPAVAREAEGQPRKWAVVNGCEGEPCPTAALASVHHMVSVWLTGRYTARPPVVVHCTGADGLDEGYFRVARSLGLLATGYGPVRLLHYVFDSDSGERVASATCWDALPTRSVWINDWDINDLWDAIFSCSWAEDTTSWTEAGGAFSHKRGIWAQKMGNTPEQWEDAFAVDAPGGAAVVADGASTGIYCRTWADELSRRFITDRPDTRDPVLLNKWVNGLRTEWRSAIQYDTLNWSKRAKVDSVGAAATLLGLEVGPADSDGNRPWRACAVGDASLFWLRDGRLLATFPVVAADQFGSAPLLIRSSPGYKTLAVAAAGACRPGDRFVLATDAVAVRLFKSAALGPGPEWSRFETIAQREWRDELDTLRRANDMVNDDCTLVVLRVSGGAEEPEWASESEAEEASRGLELAPSPTNQGADAPRSPEENFAITASVVDLVTDPPRDDEPVQEPADEPKRPVEPPPADDAPAARDGFPESTDSGV